MRIRRRLAVITAGAGLAVATVGATASHAAVSAATPALYHPTVHLSAPATTEHMSQSSNWSGYNEGILGTGGGPYTSVSGQWVVPTATQHTAGEAEDSATWVGIGGGCVDSGCDATDETLVQAGTEQDVAANGTTSYSAWYELVPAPSTTVSLAVHPGDTVNVSLDETTPGLWAISIKDLTTGGSYSNTLPYSSDGSTAEWIEETPLVIGTGGTGVATMPNLSTVNFDLATVNGKPAGLTSSDAIQLSSNGTVEATPSAPDSDSDGFNDCTYATSCATPSS